MPPCRSGLRATVVILADQDRDLLEQRANEALDGVRHRLQIVVKRGDPTTTAAVRSIAARAAGVIAVLPEADLDLPGAPARDAGQRADRAALRSVLAVRRVLRNRAVPVVVEVSRRAGAETLRLCAGAEDVVAVDARGINAQVLARAVQQPGSFDVMRQILSLTGRSVHVHPAADLAGRTFDDAHEAIENGVLLVADERIGTNGRARAARSGRADRPITG